jgi:hypothetical protein
VLTNRTSAVETAKGYSIATNLGTRGIAYAFVDLRSHSEVQGLVAGDKLHPEAYHAEVFRNGANRDYAVKYLSDGTVIDSTKLPPGEVAHPTPDQLRGTVDQLTAYFLLERQLARRHTCNLVVPVFDGSELYNLRFSDLKHDVLMPDNHQSFSGPTLECQVVRDMIIATTNRKESTYEQGRLWYASLLPGDRMMPVRMEYDTFFGAVTGYLAEVSGKGTHLEFMSE